MALSDPVSPVRIAVLRGLVCLPLDRECTELLRPVLPYVQEPEIIWTTFVPSPSMRNRILEIVQCTAGEEVSLARETLAEAEEKARKSGQESFRITARFAQLALNDYDPRSENLLADAEDAARQAEELGKSYVPDVAGLYNVYSVWLRRAANFWFRWVEEQRYQYDPASQLPSWFPMNEGPLAVSRQIEWAVSRGDTADTVVALEPALKSPVARDRFAAAQLIEWSERTKSEPSYWRFGGGSGPGYTIQASVRNMLGDALKRGSPEYDPFTVGWQPSPPPAPAAPDEPRPLFTMSLPGDPSPPPPPEPPESAASPEPAETPSERKISFWIAERENTPQIPLERNKPYTACCRVGAPVAGSLFAGNDVVPDSDVPLSGLKTHWKLVPTGLKLAAMEPSVTVATSGEAEFDLVLPRAFDSRTVAVWLTPLAAEAGLLFLIFVGDKLYRELSVSLRVSAGEPVPTDDEAVAKTTRDLSLTSLGQADLLTTHEWTTPPGDLTLYVLAPGKATMFGSVNGVPYPAGEQIYVGTDKSDLGNTVDALRKAAESLRVKATGYLNDIDPADLLNRLDGFQPQYDWAQLADFTDPAHVAAWGAVAASKELQVLAFYGRKLYDTLFPADKNSRPWVDALLPGQSVHVVWRKDSGAGWIPHLPWELLYRGDASPGVPIDPTLFWGLRYRLEYTSYDPPSVPSASLGKPDQSCCTSLLFFGDSPKEPATAEALWQRQIWTALGGKVQSCIVPTEAKTAKSEILKALTDPESVTSPAKIPVAVLYLFCHYGMDPSNNPILRFGLDSSNPDDILAEPELGTSALASRPLVFANACATAGTSVYSANVVTKAFFDRGCRAFIGTDCMVPAALASRFAVIFFYFFLRLVDKQHDPMAAGEAVAQTRLFLWCHYRNIGGLLYSYLNQYDLYMASDAEIRTLQKKG